MFLITRPNHDDVVHYLSVWSKDLINLAIKKGKNVIDLTDKKANKKRVTGTLNKTPVRLVMFNGHGDGAVWRGEPGESQEAAPQGIWIIGGTERKSDGDDDETASCRCGFGCGCRRDGAGVSGELHRASLAREQHVLRG